MWGNQHVLLKLMRLNSDGEVNFPARPNKLYTPAFGSKRGVEDNKVCIVSVLTEFGSALCSVWRDQRKLTRETRGPLYPKAASSAENEGKLAHLFKAVSSGNETSRC